MLPINKEKKIYDEKKNNIIISQEEIIYAINIIKYVFQKRCMIIYIKIGSNNINIANVDTNEHYGGINIPCMNKCSRITLKLNMEVFLEKLIKIRKKYICISIFNRNIFIEKYIVKKL